MLRDGVIRVKNGSSAWLDKGGFELCDRMEKK